MADEFNKKITLGISLGDLSGVGVEIILKTFEKNNALFELCTPIIFASRSIIEERCSLFKVELEVVDIKSLDQFIPNKLNVYEVWDETVDVILGQENPIYGQYAFKSLDAATTALKEQKINALVTAPINKHTIYSKEFPFSGHTGYLAHQLDGEALMMLVSGDLRVAVLTDHVPLSEASRYVTSQNLEKKIELLRRALVQDFGLKDPKIAVLGINPHSGDQGVIGTEEQQVIVPTLDRLKQKGYNVSGPFSADSFFAKTYQNFDAILAMYHDQGLIPFKTLSFGNGVNVTTGLSEVRTSPDHGTAHDIAAKGIADPSSFEQAVKMAIEIYKNRVHQLD